MSRDLFQLKRAVPLLLLLTIVPAPLLAEELKLTSGLAVNGEYNDNIFMATGGKQSDFITTVTPSLEISSRTERRDASASGGFNWLTYAHHSESDSVDFFGQGALGYQFDPRLALSLAAGYTRNSRLDQLDPVTHVAVKTGSGTQSYKAGASYSLTEKSKVSLGYSYAQEDFDSATFLSTREHQGSAGFSYTLAPETSLEPAFSFDTQQTDISQVDNYSVSVGLKKRFRELWSLSMNGGGRYTRSSFSAAGTTKSSNWGWIAGLAFNYSGEKLSGTVSFNHDIALVPGGTGSTERTGGSATVGDQFTRALYGNAGVGYYYNYSAPDQYSLQGINEKTLEVTCLLRYDLTYALKLNAMNNLALEASYGYYNVDYGQNVGVANKNIFMLRLVMRHAALL